MKLTCSKCDQPGFRFRGDRWLCVVHNRFDTMRNGARDKGKVVPTEEKLAVLAADLLARGMKCEVCSVAMQWAGKKGDPRTVSLQHDRSGRLRLICMGCNTRHHGLPGDLLYALPPGHWYCPRCRAVKPEADFYKGKAGSCCKPCRKKLNKTMWSQFGRQWTANSQRRKADAGR